MDKTGFSKLIKDLHNVMKPKGLILSAAVSPSKTVIDLAYDVPVLGQYLDIVNVMTYDYHGYWDSVTGHVAPLYSSVDHFNANFSLNYWAQLGVDKSKLVMGLPTYGQTFSLANPDQSGKNEIGISIWYFLLCQLYMKFCAWNLANLPMTGQRQNDSLTSNI